MENSRKDKSIKINAILNIIKTIFSIVFPLITFPYISRILLPENLGKLNFASSFVNYFSLLASLGITTYAIREISLVKTDKNKLERTASQIFSINLVTTLLSYFLLFIIIFFYKEIFIYRKLIIILSLTIGFTTIGCDWLNTAFEDFKYITIRTIMFQIISLILMFIFVKNQEDYIKYAIITVLSSSGANLLNSIYIRKYCNIKITFHLNLKKHIKPIIFLFVMLLSQTIFHNLDITMLGLLKGDYYVGLYGTSVKITTIITQVVASILWVVMPRLTNYFKESNYNELNKLLKKIFNLLISLGLPCAIGIIMLSKEIILLVSGYEYVNSYISLQILMVSFIFNLFGEFFLGNMILLPSKREKTYMIICCFTTILNIIFNYFLIPIWDINAAAFTTMISTFTMLILLAINKDKNIKLNFMKEILVAPIIGSIIIIMICLLFNHLINNMYIRIICSIGTSILVYILIMCYTKNDIVNEFIKFIKNKKIK